MGASLKAVWEADGAAIQGVGERKRASEAVEARAVSTARRWHTLTALLERLLRANKSVSTPHGP